MFVSMGDRSHKNVCGTALNSRVILHVGVVVVSKYSKKWDVLIVAHRLLVVPCRLRWCGWVVVSIKHLPVVLSRGCASGECCFFGYDSVCGQMFRRFGCGVFL